MLRRPLFLAFLAGALPVSDGAAQTCTLVKDIEPATTPVPSNPGGWGRIGDTVYFSATTVAGGPELWAMTGLAKPVQVADIRPGPIGSGPTDFVSCGNLIFFEADDGKGAGRELWRSDGTAAGTFLLKDIRPGISSGRVSSRLMLCVGKKLFFYANDGVAGFEPWVTDGTKAGTRLLKDVNPGPASSTGGGTPEFAELRGQLLFTPFNNASGRELWMSDGTGNGTAILTDLDPGTRSGFLGDLISNGTMAFFRGGTGSNVGELFRTDGTAQGTVLVKRIHPFRTSAPNDLVLSADGKTFLFSASHPIYGNELWKSDGTAEGTCLVVDFLCGPANFTPTDMVRAGNKTYFRGRGNGIVRGLHVTDGTAEGTFGTRNIRRGGDPAIFFLNPCGDLMFFEANDGVHGQELWRSNGTAAGTFMLKDINPGPIGSFAGRNPVCVDGKMVFTGRDGDGDSELWVSDGTREGTKILHEIEPARRGASSFPSEVTCCNGKIFFAASTKATGRELWVSDGTAAGTRLLKDIRPGPSSSDPRGEQSSERQRRRFTCCGGKVFFTADDGTHGRELWVSDGTPAGTVLLADIRTGGISGRPSDLVCCGNTVFFRARQGSLTELWKSDGTPQGTVVVKPGIAAGPPVCCGTTVFFAGSEAPTGTELWKSDGTAGGTVLVKDIETRRGASSAPDELVCCGGRVFFSARRSDTGRELWVSDGSGAGTVLVKDIAPGTLSSNPRDMGCCNGKVFFRANDGTNGEEPWVSAGSAGSTRMLKNIAPGANGSAAQRFVCCGGTVFFTAGNGTGRALNIELWKTDGTSAGTVQVVDLFAGQESSSPTHLTCVGGRVFFAAFADATGRELWSSDGTAQGTKLVCDLEKGRGSSSPSNLELCGGQLFFSGRTTAAGAELFVASTRAGFSSSRHETCPPHHLRMRATAPVIGRTMMVEGDAGPAGQAGAVLLGASLSSPVPVGSCLLFADPQRAVVLGVVAPAAWRLPVPVPNEPKLHGLRLTAQTLWLGPFAARVHATNAVMLQLGG